MYSKRNKVTPHWTTISGPVCLFADIWHYMSIHLYQITKLKQQNILTVVSLFCSQCIPGCIFWSTRKTLTQTNTLAYITQYSKILYIHENTGRYHRPHAHIGINLQTFITTEAHKDTMLDPVHQVFYILVCLGGEIKAFRNVQILTITLMFCLFWLLAFDVAWSCFKDAIVTLFTENRRAICCWGKETGRDGWMDRGREVEKIKEMYSTKLFTSI